MMRLIRSILASAALVATLSGCHREEKASGHGTVSGQILPGSVSDAMLPYDAVKSKAPLAPQQAVEQTANPSADTAADTADTSAVLSASGAPDVVASPSSAAPAAPD